jgi:membrane-bound lytic murein transglycosylase MltF
LTLSDDLVANFWAKVLDQLQVHPGAALAENGAMAWAFRKDTPKLKALANEFIKDHRVGTAFGSTVLRKYTGSTKWVKNATSDAELRKFRQMAELFRKYGKQYDLPHLLVAAQAYQESRLNNSLRSPAGAVGVMQIKPSTAAGNPINVRGVEQLDRNILAGAKYLRFLMNEFFHEPGVDRLNRGLFAVAAYNAGPNRIQQLRKKAQEQGLDPNRWFNNVELVAAKEIGRETVTYVSNIYKYYLAYTMITERNGQKTVLAKQR